MSDNPSIIRYPLVFSLPINEVPRFKQLVTQKFPEISLSIVPAEERKIGFITANIPSEGIVMPEFFTELMNLHDTLQRETER